MPTFQLLYFRDSVLENAEEVEVRDVLEAVQATAGRSADLRVEIWSEHRKVATIGSSPMSRAYCADPNRSERPKKVAKAKPGKPD
jgi:hypothetical protein